MKLHWGVSRQKPEEAQQRTALQSAQNNGLDPDIEGRPRPPNAAISRALWSLSNGIGVSERVVGGVLGWANV